MTLLAELLLEKEVIFKDDLEKIFGKRPFEEVLPKVDAKKEIVIEEKKEDVKPVAESTEE